MLSSYQVVAVETREFRRLVLQRRLQIKFLVTMLVGIGSFSVSAADLNQDGKLDLAVADFSGLNTLLGNGDGTFQPPTTYSTPCIPSSVRIADFNNGHKLDLIATYSSGNCVYVSIFLGNGDGTFQATPINTIPQYGVSGSGIGDFNRDGKLDLALAEQFGTVSQVEMFLGNGDGTFAYNGKYKVGSSPTSVAVADFRNNGKLDLAVATLDGGVDMLLGNGDGTFQIGQSNGTPDAVAVVADDLNGDGKLDLAVVQQGVPLGGVYVVLGNGDGTFQSPVFYPEGTNDVFVGTGDFNGDHKNDLLISDKAFSQMITLLNTGVASFSPTSPVNFPFQLLGTISRPKPSASPTPGQRL